MTLAAGGDEVVRVDGGVRVGGGQDFVVTVATGAIGDHGGTVLRGQAVITFDVGLHPVRREIVSGIQGHGRVASAAHIGNFKRRIALQRLDFMLGMTIGAGGRVAIASRHRLAVDAFRPVRSLLHVALAARFGLAGKIQRRNGRTGRKNVMRIVAILTGGGGLIAGLQRQTVNARTVTGSLPGMAKGAIDRQHEPVVVRMCCRDVGVATDAGVRFVDRRGEPGLVHE